MKIENVVTPGFAGVLGAGDSIRNVQAVDAMLRRMAYGGRTRTGSYHNRDAGVHVGWIFPETTFLPSSSALPWALPLWNAAGTVGVIASGELYSDSDQGTSGDERWRNLLARFEQEGIDSLRELNGWFGGLVIDLRENRSLLFNDRYGLFRVHWHETSEGLYFATEAKAILAAVPATRSLDFRSLAELFSCGCPLQDRTVFSGVALMPGGSAWIVRPSGEVRKDTYFDRSSWEDQPGLGLTEYYERLKETWVRILPRYFEGPPIGVSLTGGVDSRMILSWIPATTTQVSCYTFAGKYRESTDVVIARQVAAACGRPHAPIYIGDDFFTGFSELAENAVFLSDGTMDVTGAIDLYVQIIARRLAPVRVTGTNGGEIMRRLVAFKPTNLSDAPFVPEFIEMMRKTAETYAQERGSHQLSFTAFKQAPWYMNTKFSLERSHIRLRMPYFDNDLVALSYRAPRPEADDNNIALRLIADGNPSLVRIGTDRGVFLPTQPLRLRSRHLWEQFTFKLEYAYDYGMPQWLAKLDRLCTPLHPERMILGRHKFHHFRTWYRKDLSGCLKSLLLDGAAVKRPYLRRGALEHMIAEHIGGVTNYTREFHKIIAAELLQRLMIESGWGGDDRQSAVLSDAAQHPPGCRRSEPELRA